MLTYGGSVLSASRTNPPLPLLLCRNGTAMREHADR
jgi:hypothetical protein